MKRDGHPSLREKEKSKAIAMEKYNGNEVTLEETAAIAGVSIYELLEILKEKKVSYNLDVSAVVDWVE